MRDRAPGLRRDAALGNLSRVTRWAVFGTLGLVGVLSALVAQALPGRSVGAVHPGVTSSPVTSSSPAVPSTAAPGLQPPSQTPTTTQAPIQAPVMSGGS